MITYQFGGEGGWAIQSQDSTSIVFAKGNRLISFELRFNGGDPRFYAHHTAGLDLPTAKYAHELLAPDNNSLWALLKERGYPLPATIEARKEAAAHVHQTKVAGPWIHNKYADIWHRNDRYLALVAYTETDGNMHTSATKDATIASSSDIELVKKAADEYLILQGWLLK